MREKKWETVLIEKSKEITTKITCDYCGKEIEKEKKYLYLEKEKNYLFIGSDYPECDGNIYDFCNTQCLGKYIQELDMRDISFNYNSLKFELYKDTNKKPIIAKPKIGDK